MRGKPSRSRKLEIGDYNLLRRIRSPKQFDLFEIPNYVLSAILIQKIVERTIRNVKLYDPVKVAEKWKRGKLRINLPPVISLKILLKSLGYGDREIANMLKNPSEAGDFEDIVWKAVTEDFVYSPLAVKFHQVKGRLGEKMIEDFLNSIGVEFKREEELETRKTPDFLLKEETNILGYPAKWVESKFMFGDLKTHSHYWRKQYYHYFKCFGRGVVVYWPWHVGTPFSLGGDVDMKAYFRFGRLNREKFLKVVERVISDFEKGRKIEVRGNLKLLNFLKGLGFDVKVLKESHLSS